MAVRLSKNRVGVRVCLSDDDYKVLEEIAEEKGLSGTTELLRVLARQRISQEFKNHKCGRRARVD